MKTIHSFIFLFPAIVFFATCTPDKTYTVDGAKLYADVETFVALGEHRTGTPVNTETADWLGRELAGYGYTVDYPEFPIRQFFPGRSALAGSDGDTIRTFPQWWVNDAIPQHVQGLLIDADATTDYARLSGKIAFLRTSGLRAGRLIDTLSYHHVAAVVALTENLSGELAAYNAASEPQPWKIPVVLAAPKDEAKLLAYAAGKQPVHLFTEGEYREVQGRNVYGSIGTGKKHIVISTPISGWFGCGGERGPGIAVWLELARWAASLKTDYTFDFTGNSGHELSGIGAHLYLDHFAPPVDDTHLWIHLGAGIATLAYQQTAEGLVQTTEVDSLRSFFYSDAVEASFNDAFSNAKGQKYTTGVRNGGELIYVANKGYRRILGIAYSHPYFHTPQDDATSTSPRILEDLTKDLQKFILSEIKKQ